MKHLYPPEGNPERAKQILNYIAAVAGTPLPRRVREPEKFAARLTAQETTR